MPLVSASEVTVYSQLAQEAEQLKQQIDNQDGTQTWHWSQAKSHVPYLMSVVAGVFEVL